MGAGLRRSRLRWSVLGCVVLCVSLACLGGTAFSARPSSRAAALARQRHVAPASVAGLSLRGLPFAGSDLSGSVRHLPGARDGSAPARVGARVPWLSRRDSDTFLAGDGRLASKVYPFPVNYRAAHGRFDAINPNLVVSGGVARQAANNLGLMLPGFAGGAASIGHGRTALSLRLLDAHGAGQVAGRVDRFARALPGVDLAYESGNTGFGYTAKLSRAGAARGLRWQIGGPQDLVASLSRRGVEFRTRRGRLVWVLTMPTAHLSNGRTLPLHVSLSRSAGLVVIAVKPNGPLAAGATRSARRGRGMSGDVLNPPAGYPAYESGDMLEAGELYTDYPSADDTSTLTGSCTLESAAPTTSFCGQSTNQVGEGENTLLSWDIKDNLPTHIDVLQAYVSMHINSESSSTAGEIGAWASDEPWTGQATWDTYDGTDAWPTAGGDMNGNPTDQQYVGTGSDVGNWSYWDIDGPMQSWIDNASTNDGIEFSQISPYANTVSFDTLSSSSSYPYVFVYYEPRVGNYPGAKYTTQSLTARSSLGVNVASGNLEVSNEDLNLTGVNGLGVQVDRTYNDLSTDENQFGLGWSMSGADTYLSMPSDQENTIVYSDGSGDLQSYHQDVDGNWVYPPGNDATITMNTDSTSTATQYTMYFRHEGITETFQVPDDEVAGSTPVARLAKVTDQNGNTLTYAYNSGERGTLASITDTYGNQTTFTYTSAGYISQMKDPSGRTYNYVQNSSGELTSYEDPAGNYTYYTYDSYGNLTKIKTPAGRIVKIAYDAGNTNRVTSITRYVQATNTTGPTTSYAYAAPSGTCPVNPGWMQTTVGDPNSHGTTYCTDALGRIEGVIDANGNMRSTSYNSDGYMASQTSPAGTIQSYSYASGGSDNLTNVQEGSGGGSYSENFSYTDSANPYSPTTGTDAQNNETQVAYNSTGNPLTITDGLSSQNHSTLSYNSNGTVATSTDADGNETTYSYYSDGDLETVTPPSGNSLNATTITYDSLHRVSTVSTIANGSGHSIAYTYNVFDQPTKVVYKNAAGTSTTISYTYDADGNVIKRTQASGSTTYTYDGLGRLTAETFPDGTTDSYGYDPASNLTSLTDAGGTVTYGYDNANELTSVKDPSASTATALTYNSDGDLTAVSYPSGAGVTYTYNAMDQLINVADTYKTSGGATAQLTYADNYMNPSTGVGTDLLQTMTDQAGDVTTYTYDALNRLTQALTTNGSSILADYQSLLDGNGNILQYSSSGSNAVSPGTTTYAYNSGNEVCWTYTGYGFEASGAQEMCGNVPSGADQATYDGDGNLTTNNDGFSATYNALGQATSVTNNGTTDAYTYNGEGQNEIATEGSATLHNDTIGLASHSDPSGSGTDYFTRTPAGQQIDERTPSGTYNYLYDGDGNIIATTNSTGQITDRLSLDPYGQQARSGTAPSYFGFQAGYQDATGLVHFGARYLLPSEERWTQEDPLSQIGEPDQEDRYVFAGDDSANASDPTGGSVDFTLSGQCYTDPDFFRQEYRECIAHGYVYGHDGGAVCQALSVVATLFGGAPAVPAVVTAFITGGSFVVEQQCS